MPSCVSGRPPALVVTRQKRVGLGLATLVGRDGCRSHRSVGDRHPAYFWPGNSVDSARLDAAMASKTRGAGQSGQSGVGLHPARLAPRHPATHEVLNWWEDVPICGEFDDGISKSPIRRQTFVETRRWAVRGQVSVEGQQRHQVLNTGCVRGNGCPPPWTSATVTGWWKNE